MLADVVGFLACPHCAASLAMDGRVLRCAQGHSFDVARRGYVSLLRADARTDTADAPDMVAAREAFLGAGHFAPIAERLAAGAVPDTGGCIVDVGAGTGFYLAAVLDAAPSRLGVALDSSGYALRRAARAHPRVGAVRCDVWRTLPVRDEVAGCVLNVFAPRAPGEIARILVPGGRLVVVAPTSDHLTELVAEFGLLSVDAEKDDRLAAQLGGFVLDGRDEVRYRVPLGPDDAAALIAMGPSARHTDLDRVRAELSASDGSEVTVAVTVSRYRRS